MTTREFSIEEWSTGRRIPAPSRLTQPFWDGLREGRLLVQRCGACGKYVFRPEVACTRCLSRDLSWVQSSGRGSLYSYSVVHRAPAPDVAVPYVIVVVAIDEGWYLMSNLVGADSVELRAGLRLRVRIERTTTFAVPFFEIDEDEGNSLEHAARGDGHASTPTARG